MDSAVRRLDSARGDAKKKGRSRYIERESPESNRFFIVQRNAEGKEVLRQQYTIEVLDSPEHPSLPAAYDLLSQRFSSEELDPMEIMRDQMRGKRYGHEIDPNGTKAILFAIKNEKGEVVTTLDGGVLPLRDEKGELTGESVFMVFYVTTKPELEGLGLGREIMITAYQYAAQEAKRRGVKLIGGAGECTWTSRKYWERLGWRRTYTEMQDGSLAEVPYVQPPLAFELNTGEVEEGSGDAPEHFMIDFFDKKMEEDPAAAQRLARIVQAFYRTNNYINRQAFVDAHKEDEQAAEQAYQRHVSAIRPHERAFLEAVSRGKLKFLRASELKGRQLTPYYTSGEEEEAEGKRDVPVSEVF